MVRASRGLKSAGSVTLLNDEGVSAVGSIVFFAPHTHRPSVVSTAY